MNLLANYLVLVTFRVRDKWVIFANKLFPKCSALCSLIIIIPCLLIFWLFIFGDKEAVAFDSFGLNMQSSDKVLINSGGS